ncbi:hypothetical protein LX32DRAFT_319259 [Colletotrichum zoysiae]|uniref:Secreted protein n=1 Tax=Colletotrichum zoysiae TaxID=1216348 RepID=A0AAD9H2W0_9PEZI|nr:hypothetical protein LX32DRAFT_319259 [Colletotrichum zoysiae]
MHFVFHLFCLCLHLPLPSLVRPLPPKLFFQNLVSRPSPRAASVKSDVIYIEQANWESVESAAPAYSAPILQTGSCFCVWYASLTWTEAVGRHHSRGLAGLAWELRRARRRRPVFSSVHRRLPQDGADGGPQITAAFGLDLGTQVCYLA